MQRSFGGILCTVLNQFFPKMFVKSPNTSMVLSRFSSFSLSVWIPHVFVFIAFRFFIEGEGEELYTTPKISILKNFKSTEKLQIYRNKSIINTSEYLSIKFTSYKFYHICFFLPHYLYIYPSIYLATSLYLSFCLYITHTQMCYLFHPFLCLL